MGKMFGLELLAKVFGLEILGNVLTPYGTVHLITPSNLFGEAAKIVLQCPHREPNVMSRLKVFTSLIMFPEVVDTSTVRQTVMENRYLLRMDHIQGHPDDLSKTYPTMEGGPLSGPKTL